MATVNLTSETFEETVAGEGIVLVDWWASWCGPCRAFAPVFEEASNDNPDVTFAKIDTEAETDLSAAAGIQSIPTLMAFRDGILVFGQAGALPRQVLDDLLQQVRDLDMAEVRAELDRQAAQG
jgi:thioredoxin 1